MKGSQALTKYGYWKLHQFGEQDERFSTKAEGLSKLDQLHKFGVAYATLSHPMTRDEYHLGSDGINYVKNHNGLAAWLFEQVIAYTILLVGIVIAYVLFAINPLWAWRFITVSGAVGGLIGFFVLLFGVTEPGNKKFLMLGLVVFFIPALGAYFVFTNPNISAW